MTAAAGLARVTINAPHRRVDVTLPDAVPLAELLPDLLQHAGPGLADEGERHGGWLLRRADGTTLSAAVGLATQGIRDGTVLHLVPARTGWPELEFDDMVEAITAAARRQGAPWSPAATRVTALAAGGVALSVALLATLRFGVPAVGAVAAVVLVLAGALASRAYGDAEVGAVVAAYGMPFAAVAGWLSTPDRATGAERALVGGAALLLAAVAGAIAAAHFLRLFAAGAAAGVLGTAGAGLAMLTRPAAGAAVVLAVLVPGVAAVPLLAIRLGRLPVPIAALPADLASGGRAAGGPERARVFAAVARADEMLAGLLIGWAVATGGAAFVLARSGDVSGMVLAGVVAVAMLLRVRTFVTVRHRLPLIGAGLAGFVALAVFGPGPLGGGLTFAAGVAVAGLVIVVAGTRAAVRQPSPYVSRAADVLDILCVVSVVPLACAVLGLYGLLS
ncbi:type VII secretion integral membrane protein EccD [Dactylosporangium sucinum]|uniref:Type VII secretion integral membrane protein EccD n=1 Tax=Dactylosporangium sucinum TaxID=1424081 RepID=A0A917TRK8_9ACTN|nr:type VII secretion integral membrane protein EccD [Dactylosporangium sucinum]GGM33724.1 type VII secretion integral membrane protein EccD [Dactylosporangium sucinum]